MAWGVDYKVTESDKNISFNVENELPLQDLFSFLSESLVEITDEVFREEKKEGFDENPRIFVDGKEGKAVELVKPFGKIELFSKINSLRIMLKAFDAIEQRSPVRSGSYLANNYVFANEKIIARSKSEFEAWIKKIDAEGLQDIKSIRFLNATPYAAKLEIQGVNRSSKGVGRRDKKTRKSRAKGYVGKIVSKPNGAYATSLSRVKFLLKGIARADGVKLQFMPNGFSGNILGKNARYKSTNENIRLKRVGKPYVFPSIKVEF